MADEPLQFDTVSSGDQTLHRIRAFAQQPIARVIFLHGYGDHAARYVHFYQWLATHNLSVTAFDFRGHGRSTGPHACIRSWDDYFDDLSAILAAENSNDAGSTSRFIIAHSAGALIAADAIIRRKLKFAGCVFCSPLFGVEIPVDLWKRALAPIMSVIIPNMRFKSYLSAEKLSRDPGMIADTRADPLCQGVGTPRWFTEATRARAETRRRAGEFELPLQILLAGDDCIVSNSAAQKFLESAASADKSLKIYPGARHELLREIERISVFEDIYNWIAART